MKFLFLILFISTFIFPQQGTLKVDSLIQTKDTLTANKNYIQNIFVTNKISFLQKYQGLIGAFRGSLFGRINTLNDMVEKLLNAIIKEIEKSETSNVFH